MTAPPTTPAGGLPAAEHAVDADLARTLLRAQHPDLADLPIALAASGWDNVVFRLGRGLALRIPRRAVAAQLLRNEQIWLPVLKDRLPLAIPAPVRIGAPEGSYPWPWSVTPWFEGATADLEPPDDDQAEVLAGFFNALHAPAPPEAPRNPHRGVPLADRQPLVEQRIASLSGRGRPIDERILAIWADALDAPNDAAPTWIQGDPHPRNVLVRDGKLTAIIDWGDLAQGDRASDLSAIWMLLASRAARERAIAALPAVSPATWRRARGWAAHYGALLLDAGLINDPPMVPVAEGIFQRLIEGP